MKFISIFLILLIILGFILYLYFKNKDTFITETDAIVDIAYTVEVVGIDGYKFKDISDSSNTYLTDDSGSDLNPTLILEDGKTYSFNNSSNNGQHPFNLKSKDDTVVGIKDDSGTIILTATFSEKPYRYHCSYHPAMVGSMEVPAPAPAPAPSTPLQSLTAQTIIETQSTLLDNLNILLFNIQNILQSSNETNTQVIDNVANETFINMPSVRLNPNEKTEIYNYANTYNKNIALLDDPNKMTQASFDTYIYIQNKKINNLKKELKLVEEQIQNTKLTKNKIKSFKSMNNSQMINVELYDDENNNNSGKYPNYLIYGNNGCLDYDNKKEYESVSVAPTWKFNSCNANNSKQQFVSNKINDLESYNSYIDNNNKENILNDDSNIMFGFNIINPIDDDKKCLQINNDGISVMPCTLKYDQRFQPSYNSVLQ